MNRSRLKLPNPNPLENPPVFNAAVIAPRPAKRSWKVMIPVWCLLLFLIWLGFRFDMDAKAIAGFAIVFGILSSAFTWILGMLALFPILGPLLVKVLALPVIWLLNALGYLVSVVAIRRGYSQDVLTYRGLTIALLIGIVIGYVIGKLI
jgi:hypothetical protein